jgi:hypothetical protein
MIRSAGSAAARPIANEVIYFMIKNLLLVTTIVLMLSATAVAQIIQGTIAPGMISITVRVKVSFELN